MIGVGGEGGYFLQFLFTCFRADCNTFTAAEGSFEYGGLFSEISNRKHFVKNSKIRGVLGAKRGIEG